MRPAASARTGQERHAASIGVIGPAAVIVVGAVLAYANTFQVPLVFDDVGAVIQNPSIEHLSTAFTPPSGLSVSGRPFANLSLALNYAISGRAVWSYHATNLTLHVAGALLLFAILRDALRRYATGNRGEPAAESLNPMLHGSTDRGTTWAAGAATLIWALHPLQTAAVTYIMQRTELLAAACTLLALYGFVRSIRETEARQADRPLTWPTISVVACWSGMAAKEVAVVTPLLVLLYDATFHAGSVRQALRHRHSYYTALFLSWTLLGGLLLLSAGRAGSAGFSAGVGPWDYLTTQAYAIGHYARLAIWPAGLVFDYGTLLVHQPALILPGAIGVAALVVLAAKCWRRQRAATCAIAWFFLLLAPSSSLVPVATQTMGEHRLYLALAAPIVLVVVLLHRLLGRRFLALAVVAGLALGVTTLARNAVYRTERSLWGDTVAKRPASARGWYNLGLAEIDAGDRAAALVSLTRAAAGDPANAGAHDHLGQLLAAAGKPAEALPHFQAVVAARPQSAQAHTNVGNALLQLGRASDALGEFEAAARLDPRSANIQLARGNALVQLNRTAEAAEAFAAAVRTEPTLAAAHYNHGGALAQLGHYAEALAEFEEASRLDPNDAAARTNAARLRDYLRP